MTHGITRQQRQWVGLASAGLTFAFALAHAALGDWLDAAGAAGSSVLALALVALDRRLPGDRLIALMAGLGLSTVFASMSAATGSPQYLAFLGLVALLAAFLQGPQRVSAAVLAPVLTGLPLAVWLAHQRHVPDGGAPAEALRGLALVVFLLMTGLAFERVRDDALARAVQGTRRARRAEQSQARLLERVSHAVAEPLHGVLDVARGLEAGRLGETARRDLELLQGAAGAQLTLVTDLIHLAAARSGDQSAQASATDVGARVGAVVARWRAASPGARLDWAEPPALMVRTDPAALELVADRMLGHALATAGGAPVLAEVRAAGPGGVVVEVSGGPPLTGAGAARLLEPFAEGDDLRLATAREVARSAGAVLQVVPGRPTFTVRLELPAEPGRPAAAPPPRPAGAPDAWRQAFTVQLVGTLAVIPAISMVAYLALGAPWQAAVAGAALGVTLAIKALVGRGRWRAATTVGAVGLGGAFASAAFTTGSATEVGYLGVSAVALVFVGGLGQARLVLGVLSAAVAVAVVAVVRTPAAPVTPAAVVQAALVIPTLLLLARSYEGARRRALADALAAQASAEAAALAQTRFLQGASHQLRTPLHGILGMAQTLWGEVPGPTERRAVETLARCATAMHARVNELIDAARAGASEVQLAPEPVDLRVLLEDAVSLHRPAAERKGLTLSAVLPPGGEWVLADESRLRQVLETLLANAVRFSPRGTVAVEATLAAAAGDRPLLTVEVADAGSGIPAAALRLLAGAEDPAEAGSATALGLAIARDVARAMGGTLAVLASGPQGTRFRLQVPLPRVAAPAQPSPLPAPWPARVLVVDDNPINLAVATRLLARLGAEAVTAASAEAAVACARGARFDLVLMDLQMPDLDGFEAARRLRAQGLAAPVVALTASAQPETPGECRAAGMAGCLVKPVKLSQLAKLLDGLQDRRAA